MVLTKLASLSHHCLQVSQDITWIIQPLPYCHLLKLSTKQCIIATLHWALPQVSLYYATTYILTILFNTIAPVSVRYISKYLHLTLTLHYKKTQFYGKHNNHSVQNYKQIENKPTFQY